jgi:hypothetical protein
MGTAEELVAPAPAPANAAAQQQPTHDVVTQEIEDAPALQKKETPKKTSPATPTNTVKKNTEVSTPAPPKPQPKALYPGSSANSSTSEGTGNKTGDQGKPNGSPFGDAYEGNVWEAAMLAGKEKLSNIIAWVDRNNIQIDGPTETVMPLEDLKAKWLAFGWHVMEIDGNNMEAIIDACAMAKAIIEKPIMILAHTVPGMGVDFMEYDFHWHGKPPNHDEAKKALHELRTLGGKIRSEHE